MTGAYCRGKSEWVFPRGMMTCEIKKQEIYSKYIMRRPGGLGSGWKEFWELDSVETVRGDGEMYIYNSLTGDYICRGWDTFAYTA